MSIELHNLFKSPGAPQNVDKPSSIESFHMIHKHLHGDLQTDFQKDLVCNLIAVGSREGREVVK